MAGGGAAYKGLAERGYQLEMHVQHGKREVMDQHLPKVHLFFSNLKAWLNGTFHGASSKYLARYVDEFVYRFNRRSLPNLFDYFCRRAMQSTWTGADGAYDTRAVYAAPAAVGTPGIDIAIPPRRTASSSGPSLGTWQQREAALLRIDEVGRRQWRKESGAHQQARAENGMYRFKQIVGARLRSRSPEAQRREAMIGVNILNRMTELGMPESRAVRS